MLKYEVYRIEDDHAVLDSICEFETNNPDGMKIVRMFDKNPDFYVRACDADSIWELKKPKRPGLAKLTDDLVLKCFQLKAQEQLSSLLISRRLYKDDDITVSPESIDKVLKRKTYADVVIPQELLDRISIQKSTRKKRTAITEEDKKKILKLHDCGNGLTGRQISQMDEFDYSDVTINRFLRNELGFMVNGVRSSGTK